jgi:hypothetical protein
LRVGYWSKGYYYSSGHRYVGNGEVAMLAEVVDVEVLDQARRQRDQARELELTERQEFLAARRAGMKVDALVKAGLEAAGYHRLRRHHWRRRRTMATQIQTQAAATATYELAEMVQASYVFALAGQSAETRDELKAKLALLRTQLAGPDPSPALELATAAAVHAWLDYWTVEMIAAVNPGNITQAVERRRIWSSRRYSQALVTCERIRQLARPRGPRVAIQVSQMITPPEPCLALAQ